MSAAVTLLTRSKFFCNIDICVCKVIARPSHFLATIPAPLHIAEVACAFGRLPKYGFLKGYRSKRFPGCVACLRRCIVAPPMCCWSAHPPPAPTVCVLVPEPSGGMDAKGSATVACGLRMAAAAGAMLDVGGAMEAMGLAAAVRMGGGGGGGRAGGGSCCSLPAYSAAASSEVESFLSWSRSRSVGSCFASTRLSMSRMVLRKVASCAALRDLAMSS